MQKSERQHFEAYKKHLKFRVLIQKKSKIENAQYCYKNMYVLELKHMPHAKWSNNFFSVALSVNNQ